MRRRAGRLACASTHVHTHTHTHSSPHCPIRYDEAMPIYERAMEIASRELGLSHAFTQLTRNNMAEVMDTKGDRPAAR